MGGSVISTRRMAKRERRISADGFSTLYIFRDTPRSSPESQPPALYRAALFFRGAGEVLPRQLHPASCILRLAVGEGPAAF